MTEQAGAPYVPREAYGVVSATDGQRVADLEATLVKWHRVRVADARVMERLERRCNELEGAITELNRAHRVLTERVQATVGLSDA